MIGDDCDRNQRRLQEALELALPRRKNLRMKTGTLPTSALMIPVVGLLVLAGAFFVARPALAQTEPGCPLPPDWTPPPVTAEQVENGSATLEEFALAARDVFRSQTQVITTLEQATYLGCIVRQEGSAYRSGSTYLIQLTPDGRVFIHSKAMALSGRLLNPLIYGSILSALGVPLTDLVNLASPDSATVAEATAAVFNTLMQEPAAAFDATASMLGLPGIRGASGHAAVYVSATFGLPIVLLAGFDLDESHLAEEDIDYGDPAITAKDVVDRETLKAFVTEAGNYFLTFQESGDIAAPAKAKVALRDPNGPYRHGSVYLYVLDTVSNVILFHGAFPDRHELRPLVATVRDVVTGELILPQVIAAAKSDPEGGFVEYYFDDPTDDTDSADIPKVGYAREFTGEFDAGGRVLQINFIVGSGFYGSAPEDIATSIHTEVEATVLGTSGLAPNVPNPFNSATQIAYHLSSPGPVRLAIYNVLGQPVRTLVDQFQAAGSYQVQWDARDQRGGSLSSGVYITRLSYPGGEQTRRLLYLK